MEKRTLSLADRERGQFRTLLLTALKHDLLDLTPAELEDELRHLASLLC